LLVAATLLLSKFFSLNPASVDLVSGQLIGFATLTLPVILYFTLSENSRYAGTPGKRRFKLQVVSAQSQKAGLGHLLLRNCLKFLPWELAHFFIYRLFHFNRQGIEPPDWVLAGLIAAQVLAIIYFACLVFSKGNRSIYEWASGTRVIQHVSKTSIAQ
jgi:uncharacterized RDD family membrane protein YckC